MATGYSEEKSKKMIESARGGQIIQYELNDGADPNYRDEQGYSALDYATGGRSGYNSFNGNNIAALIEAGVDPYESVPNGKSPIDNILREVIIANKSSAVSTIIVNAIDSAARNGKERPEEFITQVRANRPDFGNQVDAIHADIALETMVKGRNKFLQRQLQEARAAATGVEVEPKHTAPEKQVLGSWTDSVITVGANHPEHFRDVADVKTR